jgi:hypothetical protein
MDFLYIHFRFPCSAKSAIYRLLAYLRRCMMQALRSWVDRAVRSLYGLIYGSVIRFTYVANYIGFCSTGLYVISCTMQARGDGRGIWAQIRLHLRPIDYI